METVGIIFQLVAALLGILAAGILYWVNKDDGHANKVLILLLLTLALLNINGVLYYSRWLLYIPWWHKITQPFAMLVAPLAFIYTRSILRHQYRFFKKDILLLLPFVLVAINFLPYYSLPVQEKKNYLLEFYKNSELKSNESEGFLPAYLLAFFRVCWSFTFIFLNFILLRKFKKNASAKLLADNAGALQWLKQLNSMLMALTVIALVASVMAPLIKTNFNLISLALGTFVLIICLNLFTRPKILYGIYQPFIAVIHKAANAVDIDTKNILEPDNLQATINISQSIDVTDTSRYKKLVETHFNDKRPFLNATYSLEQLGADTGIPRTILSAFINKEYGMGFREFLNRHRVDYLIQNLHRQEWKQFTIEAIAIECGFGNRNTFFKNFKQITGQTPSDYLKQYQQTLQDQQPQTEAGTEFVRFVTNADMK